MAASINVTSTATPALQGHTLTYIGENMFLAFGGYDYIGYTLESQYQTWDFSQGLTNTLYLFNSSDGSWSYINPYPDAILPSPRVSIK